LTVGVCSQIVIELSVRSPFYVTLNKARDT